jgi:hypothetical protein
LSNNEDPDTLFEATLLPIDGAVEENGEENAEGGGVGDGLAADVVTGLDEPCLADVRDWGVEFDVVGFGLSGGILVVMSGGDDSLVEGEVVVVDVVGCSDGSES